MSVEYTLVNQTKKEVISFAHLNGSKIKELAGNPAQSAIATWYLLNNSGDDIQFVSDTYDDWPFKSGNKQDLNCYPDRTNEVLSTLIENGILKDNGYLYIDQDEPNTVYVKDIINVWASN
jgi:hypothetical protein